MRKFAIFNTNKTDVYIENILEKLPEGSKVLIYSLKSAIVDDIEQKKQRITNKLDIQTKIFPEELGNNIPKLRNYLFKDIESDGNKGFLHVIEDTVQIEKDPVVFLDEIEKMMKVFKLKSWFNTSCDECNFIYQKYNPRFFVAIDEDEVSAKYQKTIAWCSNANTIWICYDMDTAKFEDVRLEERFEFPMYFIIEFLARRRNTKTSGQLDYMNFYPSIPEELGVFKIVEVDCEKHDYGNDIIEKEGIIFKEMGVDNHPDMSIEQIMDDMKAIILQN